MKKKKTEKSQQKLSSSFCLFLPCQCAANFLILYFIECITRPKIYIQTYPHGAASVVQLDYTQCCACMLNMRVASNRESKIMTRKNLISV